MRKFRNRFLALKASVRVIRAAFDRLVFRRKVKTWKESVKKIIKAFWGWKFRRNLKRWEEERRNHVLGLPNQEEAIEEAIEEAPKELDDIQPAQKTLWAELNDYVTTDTQQQQPLGGMGA